MGCLVRLALPRRDQVGTVEIDWHGCDNCDHCVDGECLIRYTLVLQKVEPQSLTDPEYVVVCKDWTAIPEEW